MEILIKNANIAWETSEYHGHVTDILIKDGRIAEIGKIKHTSGAKVIEGNTLYCAPGLCDIGTHNGEPGYEHRENFDSLAAGAICGGYTHLVVFPNTKPVTQTRADVLFILENAERTGVHITPAGALSKDCKGEDLSEFLDMHSAGVNIFSDGLKPVADAGLLKRALIYGMGIGAVIIHHPADGSLGGHGEMHEGRVSTFLGLPGIPDIAEHSMLYRDMLICEYSGGKMISHAISSAGSLNILKEARQRGVSVQATTAYLNLIKTDESLSGFDTNLKVRPPLRAASDRAALIQAVMDNTAGAIVTNHVPLEEELKKVEFPYAAPGATGLETCLPACITYLKDEIPVHVLLHKLSIGPRMMLDIPVPELKAGAIAELCVVDADSRYTYTSEQNRSFSGNNPFFGSEFTARVLATIAGKKAWLAE
ncbi:MAG: dihydroorotase [Saprospiraceae bacterium]|nr:dihydroorotase [Saprospiraceae bacterium]